jgi:hypothetical protein
MFLKPITFIAIIVAGWALGRARPAINIAFLVLAVFGAISAHSTIQWAFLDGRLDTVLGDPREDGFAHIAILVAAGEASGLWVTFLLIPWARFGARIPLAFYALAASALAALAFYFPFDAEMLNSEWLMPPDGPPYLLAAVACLPIAAVGFLIGWLGSSRETRIDDEPRLG